MTTYTKEFKQEAVRLMETSDRPAAEIAMERGIFDEISTINGKLPVSGGIGVSGEGCLGQ